MQQALEFLNAKHHKKRRRKRITEKHHQNKKNHKKHCQKTSPVYLFIYFKSLKALSETLPNKNKKHRNHYQKHYQRRRSRSIAGNITKFLDTQKYKYHIVKQKTFSAIPCFLPHEPKRREKNKK
jgi:hypothetical protein